MPAKYATAADPMTSLDTSANIDAIAAGKAIYVANCSFCHGYSGTGNGPDAPACMPAPAGLLGHDHLQGLDAAGLLLARLGIHPDASDAAVEVLVRLGPAVDGRELRARDARVPQGRQRAGRPGDPRQREGAQDPAERPA